MSSRIETPSKPSRRSQRPSKNPVSSHKSSSQRPEPSADSELDKQLKQPMRILRRGDPETVAETYFSQETSMSSPQTPRRPKSMYEGYSSPQQQQQQHRDNLTPEPPRSKKKTPVMQGRKQSAPVPSKPNVDGTPVSSSRRESAPPTRANETPTKAYAGPTFHASPAASSLPLPKFYSKSVPSLDKTKSLTAMMEQDSPESGSGSEESPSLGQARLHSGSNTKEDSPLDIFFRADRKAKSCFGNTLNAPSSPNAGANALDSPSHLRKTTRDHSRQFSAGGIFALEMDGAPLEASGGPILGKGTSNSPKNLPSASLESPRPEQPDAEEQRKAKTLALKKLLYSPRPQISHHGSTGSRPPSSGLRKEIPMPTSPNNSSTPELPATPTAFDAQRSTTPLMHAPKTAPNGYISPSHPMKSSEKQSQGRYAHFTHDKLTTKSMENDLRRILKLDILGDDGVTGH